MVKTDRGIFDPPPPPLILNRVKSKIPSVTGVATTPPELSDLTNEGPNVSNLVKKANFYAKLSDIEEKIFITSEYKKFMTNILDVKIKNEKLVTKSGISGFIYNSDLDKKIKWLATKERIKRRAT